MNVINIHEAKTNFSKLLDSVANGEQIIIRKASKPIARLDPFYNSRVVHRQFKVGNLELQAHSKHKLTPEYMHWIEPVTNMKM